MSRAERVQGCVFCLGALGAVGLSLLGRLSPAVELWAVAAAVVVFGVPHGALDPVLARARAQWTAARWAGFWLGYAALAALVVAVWAGAPALFLAGFLLVSAAHFAGDPAPGAPWPVRVLHGGAPLVLPAFLHGAEVEGLFALLAGPGAAAAAVAVLAPLSGPWLVACLCMAIVRRRADPWGSGELLCLALLATVAPPLVGFAVFFCLCHSARHVLRTAEGVGAPVSRILLQTAAPMAVVVGGGAAAWLLLDGVPVDARVMQVVFVGLASLTVPHMLVVWGWLNAAPLRLRPSSSPRGRGMG